MMKLPFGLLAELTYRCPLQCPYCSNPRDLAAYRSELSQTEWEHVLGEARALGVLQVHFSGGEPLLRQDLVALARHARALGLYTNLITSGISLTQAKAEQLQIAGLDHIQISLQAAEADVAQNIAGVRSHARKIQAAHMVKSLGFPLTINIVLHRRNLDQLEAMIILAESLHADRLELAHTQYYGWALLNRAALLPTKEQVLHAEQIVQEARARLGSRMYIIHVVPDYYSDYPKPCMHGWGASQLVVTPIGDVWPCLAAAQLGLPRENVQEHPLAEIWESSALFNRFRGYDWMPEPCQSCPRKKIDFGGCRCQAFQLTGDPAATDPVCKLSKHHSLITSAVEQAQIKNEASPFVHRQD